MGRNRDGKGEEFLEGRIADENLRRDHHGHGEHHGCPPGTLPITTVLCGGGQILPTCATHVCGPQLGADCCWIVLATTNCSTTAPNGTTCCWRILATTDCTTTVRGAACCWQILWTTDCTTAGFGGGDDSDC